MTDACSLDWETRSRVDLKTQGVAVYAADPSTDVLMGSYRISGGPVRRWRPGQPMPKDLREYVLDGGPVYAWNAAFERLHWNGIMVERHGWPRLPLRQFRCTASVARALSLPGSLDNIGPALGLKTTKDPRGKALIKMFSVPRKDGTFTPPEGPDFEAFHDYCDQDVIVEDAAREKMVPLSDDELEVYWLSERINDRGIGIDRATAHQALRIVDQVRETSDAEIHRVTGGAVEKCSQVARLLDWIRSQGVDVASGNKADLDLLLERRDVPSLVREAIDLRLLSSKASVDKLDTMLERTNSDGRSRHCFVYHTAGTGRFSAVGWQAQNLPRPRREFAKALERGDLNIDTAMNAVASGEAGMLPLLYGDELGKPLHLVSDLLRSFLIAAPKHEFMVADYSGIEGVVGAWVCREEWKIQAMRELQSPAGKNLPDLYIRTAAGIYGVPTASINDKDPRRQVGKVAELSLQYQGGVSAAYAMGRNYGLDWEEVYEPVWNAADETRQDAAAKRYAECCKKAHYSTKQLSEKAWLAAELVKVGWRAVHPAIVGAWPALGDACRAAVEAPGSQHTVYGCTFLVTAGFLWLRLPTGRCLAFGNPQIREVVAPWADSNEPPPTRERMSAVTVLGTEKGKLTRYPLYGGLILENIVQAIARDILVRGMLLAERAGYPTVLHIHDEVVAEVPTGWGDDAQFRALLLDLPPALRGMPLGLGKIHRMRRYRKA